MTALSRFLPADFNAGKPVALIAGQGDYPVRVAAAMRAANVPVRLIAFDEETRAELVDSFAGSERRTILVGQLGHMLSAMRDFGAGYALMAGQITPRRLFKGLHPDWKAAKLLFSLKLRNAETIFGAIAGEIAEIGIEMLDARSFLDGDLAVEGSMTGDRLPVPREFLDHGIRIAREMARLDVGQGVVVRKGTVVAVEAFEGTDAMLRRAGEFKTDNMVFVKCVKPAQDFRFDVPVFGMRTLETMREARVVCAALEAGSTIMLDRERLVGQARSWGIHLHGFA